MQLADHVYERLLQRRIVVLGAAIDQELADRVCGQLLRLSAEDPAAEVTLYVNSPGGTVSAGMAVWDTMEFVGCPVATWVMGVAVGTAQLLLAAGTPGRRHALSHAKVHMIAPSVPPRRGPDDTAHAAVRQTVFQIIAHQTGQTVAQITRDADEGRWFDAEQALEYGFVDHIVSRASPGTA